MKCFEVTALCLVLISLAQAINEDWEITVSNGNNNAILKEYGNSQRIVGGEEAVPHSFPYQVGMFIKVWGQDEKVFCGGSLLTEYFVLTAAHCVFSAYEAEVILGAHNVHEVEATQQRFTTKVFMVHKGWNGRDLVDDIAIVRLPRPAKFTDEVQPIRLPKSSDQHKTFAFKLATVSGWGKTSDASTAINSNLRRMQSKVTLPLVCKISFFGKTGPNQMCIDGNKGDSTCSGDSGGPLVLPNKNGEPVQQGIVSFGIGFGCEKGWPQVFTKVSKYLKWIYEHTGIAIVP